MREAIRGVCRGTAQRAISLISLSRGFIKDSSRGHQLLIKESSMGHQ